MNKILTKALVTVLLFFVVLLGLNQIDWVKHLEIKDKTDSIEAKLGEMLEEQILASKDTITNPAIFAPIRSILNRICENNNIDSADIKMYIVDDSEINAFALPNKLMIVNKGLILESTNEEGLAGVIGHELAHITEKHVMKRLIREMGLSMLISLTSGGGGAGVSEVIKNLTSSAYDRELESEADMKSVEFLQNANIDPEPFAEFMYHMSTLFEMPKAMEWVSSHPDSEERSKAIIEQIDKDRSDYVDLISDEDWKELQESLKGNY